MLFTAWMPDPIRPTQDLDLLGFGDDAVAAVVKTIARICNQDVPDDGLVFDTKSIKASEIRTTQDYGGVRVKLTAFLAKTQIPVQIDIGVGDAVTPGIIELEFPPLLDAPAPKVRAYPKEAVLAEKLHAIVAIGQINTRMKDYYDLLALARLFDFDGEIVRDAIVATFARRGTALPAVVPTRLTEAFANDQQKIALWQSFAKREILLLNAGDLVAAVADVAAFVMPPLEAARKAKPFTKKWTAGGPWKSVRKKR
jgi:hypothetical protein